MKTIGGNVCVRNGNSLDYCWREAIQSLLPVCDEVVVCDGESTDGTQEDIREWAGREPKIKVCVYPWPNPKGDVRFWSTWLNTARQHLKTDIHLQLDADEVLHENSYEAIRNWARTEGRFSLWCDRWNFYADHQHLIPPGVCLAHRVVRFAPQDVWMPSDGPDPRGAEAIGMAVDGGITIGHYGFLRRREAYFAKSKELQGMFFDSYDQRLADAEKTTGNWMRQINGVEWTGNLIEFKGEHPKIIRPWLKERGWV